MRDAAILPLLKVVSVILCNPRWCKQLVRSDAIIVRSDDDEDSRTPSPVFMKDSCTFFTVIVLAAFWTMWSALFFYSFFERLHCKKKREPSPCLTKLLYFILSCFVQFIKISVNFHKTIINITLVNSVGVLTTSARVTVMMTAWKCTALDEVLSDLDGVVTPILCCNHAVIFVLPWSAVSLVDFAA